MTQQNKMEKLVNELMKDRPNKKIISQLTRELKIPQSSDILVQTNHVLQSMDAIYKAKTVER